MGPGSDCSRIRLAGHAAECDRIPARVRCRYGRARRLRGRAAQLHCVPAGALVPYRCKDLYAAVWLNGKTYHYCRADMLKKHQCICGVMQVWKKGLEGFLKRNAICGGTQVWKKGFSEGF